MVVTFATPLIKVGSNAAQAVSKNSKSISEIFVSLFKNKGVQLGVGLGATAAGVSVLGSSAKEAVQPFPELSPIIVFAIIGVILLLLFKGGAKK